MLSTEAVRQSLPPQVESALLRRRSALDEAAATFERARQTFARASSAYQGGRSIPAHTPAVPYALKVDSRRALTAPPPATNNATLLRAVAGAVDEAVCALDAGGRVLVLNPAAETLLGRTEVELSGRPWHEAVCLRRSLDEPIRPFALPEAEGERTSVEYLVTAGDDSVRVVAIAGSPIRADGGVVGTVMTLYACDEPAATTPASVATPAELGTRAARAREAAEWRRGAVEPLTPREREVLDLLLGGITSDRELAETLVVSQNTVKYHLGNLLAKFRVRSRAQLVARARVGADAAQGA